MFKLTEVEPRMNVLLMEVQGGKSLKAKLIAQGFVQGAAFEVLDRLGWGGPVLVEINGIKIAIGRSMAERILVKPLPIAKGMLG
jgi:ferrous iron transport protein A